MSDAVTAYRLGLDPADAASRPTAALHRRAQDAYYGQVAAFFSSKQTRPGFDAVA